MIYTIYTQSLCGYCVAAKQLMKECGIPYNEISLDNNQDAKNLMKEKGYKTVPQIFDGELNIGGYTELRTFLTK